MAQWEDDLVSPAAEGERKKTNHGTLRADWTKLGGRRESEGKRPSRGPETGGGGGGLLTLGTLAPSRKSNKKKNKERKRKKGRINGSSTADATKRGWGIRRTRPIERKINEKSGGKGDACLRLPLKKIINPTSCCTSAPLMTIRGKAFSSQPTPGNEREEDVPTR